MVEPTIESRPELAALRLERRDLAPARRRRRGTWIAAGAALVLVAAFAWRQTAASRAVAVEVVQPTVVSSATPGQAAAVPVLSGAGYVVSADRYIAIGVTVPGRIERYLVEEGDHVKAGDSLVQLDARQYEAAVRRTEAALASARAAAELRRAQLTRAEQLHAQGVVGREELDVRRAEARAADAAVGQTEAELAKARVDLEYTTLRAPRGGVILSKVKEVGEIAVPGGFSGSGDLIRMANLEDLRGQVDVTESELAKVAMGQRAEVIPDAYPDRRYGAHVVKIYPQIDRQKGTLRVEVQIEKPDEYLWPDMSARVTFMKEIEATVRGALLVPRGAVREDAGTSLVWVIDGDVVRRTPVTLGGTYGDRVQVTAGLTGTERLVANDAAGLRDGQLVRTPPR
ncbi:MAG: efflux RND transporter periplasmic adaptor subunit [Candidatus Binatia bacterium]